jgi:hypothetical protein
MQVSVEELVAAIDPKPISDIDITIRSEWVYDPEDAGGDTRSCGLLLAFLQARHKSLGNKLPLDIDQIRIVGGKMDAEGRSALDYSVQQVVGYFNREEEVAVVEKGKAKNKKRDTGGLEARLNEDRKLDSEWAAFVRTSARAPHV